MADVETPTEEKGTVEEQLATAQTEKADLTTQLEEKTKGLKTAHDNLRRKDDELKRHTDIAGRFSSLEDQFKFLTGYMAESQGKTGDDFDDAKATRSPDLLRGFQKITEDSERKRRVESQRQESLSKINAIRDRADALGLPEDDEVYWEIEDLATRGKFERAEAKLKKLEKKEETPKETEDKVKERLEREILEKHGLLTPEQSAPSATGGKLTAAQVQKMSPDERFARADEIAKIPMGYTSLKQ